jgi:hypothetical protein
MAQALVTYWEGDSTIDPTDWTRGENWDQGVVPQPGDHALIHTSGPSTLGMPVIRTSIGGMSYVTPSWHDVHTSLEIAAGGRLECSNFYLGYGAGVNSMGVLKITGGDLCTRYLQVGYAGNGKVELTSGTVNVLVEMTFGQNTGGGTGLIDIAGGRILIAANRLNVMQNATNAGWITAYGGAGRVVIDFNQTTPGFTTIWALPLKAQAWAPRPGQQSTISATSTSQTVLGWQAGVGATQHEVFFGSSQSAVETATAADRTGIFRGRLSTPQCPLPDLNPGSTYFWRIDELTTSGATTHGQVWAFSVGQAGPGPLLSDTWVATDAIGRTLPGRAECGPVRSDRVVGIYYVQWFGYHGTDGPYNATETIAANPANPAWLPTAYWWDEPEVGYFLADDRWMIRRDIAMLTEAGIDVVIFEATNGFPYTGAAVTFLNELQKMEQQGYHSPLKFCFWTNAGSPNVVATYYNEIYAQGAFADRWFYWKGKPLMLGYPDGLATDNPRTSVTQEIRNFFNWRSSWAWDAGKDKWQFVDTSPQDYSWSEARDRPEQTVISAASHPTNNIGKSFQGGVEPTLNAFDIPVADTSGQGLQFAEQSARARMIDPEFLWLTEWNEWIATCFTQDGSFGPIYFHGNLVPTGGHFFIDQYNREFNRDLAPMKGGYTDNYYYQMIDTIRRYKGVNALPIASGVASIAIDGNFNDWRDIKPSFGDVPGDTLPRDKMGWGTTGMLRNATGRNDIVEARVARDAQNISFYVRTREALTPPTGINWMLLFIDSDRNHLSGWQGYDYVVNLGGIGASTTTLRRSGSSWSWNLISTSIPIRIAGNQLELNIPRAALDQGSGDDPVALDFHWADNIAAQGDITEFFTQGDSAPDRRFNYRYQTSPQNTTLLLNEDWEGASPTPWGDWQISTDAAYSGTHSLECTRDNNSGLLVGLNTAGYQSFRLSFRYKLVNVWNSYPVQIYYHDGTQWNYIADISSSPPNVWLQYVDVRLNSGADAHYFTPNLAFHVQGASLAGVTQAVYIDDVRVEAIGGANAASQPFPPTGATHVPVDIRPGWTAGNGVNTHRIYFGTTSPAPFFGEVADAEQFDPGTTLKYQTTYYWRVDELTSTGTISGPLWSFTSAPPPAVSSNAQTTWALY